MNLKKSMSELERIDVTSYAETHREGLVVVLDNLRSAHNVGSIFRTSDSFGVRKIYLCGITCKTDHRELMKTALGAELSVPSEWVSETKQAIHLLQSEGYIILSLEQTKQSKKLSQYSFIPNQKYAIVLGNEVEGVADDIIVLSDDAIEIPQVGTKHSLNVTNAASIFIWEYFKQQI